MSVGREINDCVQRLIDDGMDAQKATELVLAASVKGDVAGFTTHLLKLRQTWREPKEQKP